MKSFLARIVLLAAFAVVLAVVAHGVGTTGTLVGTVTDAKGGALSGAKVAIKNVGTDAVREVPTSVTGEYSVPLLPPGEYEVTIESGGFKRAVFSGIKLEVDQTIHVDASLEIGELSQQVTVTEAAPLVQVPGLFTRCSTCVSSQLISVSRRKTSRELVLRRVPSVPHCGIAFRNLSFKQVQRRATDVSIYSCNESVVDTPGDLV